MKKTLVVLMAVVVGIFCATAGEAAPKTGFGLDFGLASNSMEGTFVSGPGNGIQYSYSSSGLSIGIDYQIAVNDQFSINPFLMSSSESVSGDLISGTRAGHGILGLEGRFWMDQVFLGLHVADYSEVLTNPNAVSISGSGTGFGLTAGWEDDHGGLFVMGQIDKASLTYADSDNKLTGFRFSVGHRW
jgi:hypothetical protein